MGKTRSARFAAVVSCAFAFTTHAVGQPAADADGCAGSSVDLNRAFVSDACVVRGERPSATSLAGLVVELTPSRARVRSGRSLDLRVTLRNTTDAPITLVVLDSLTLAGLGDPTPTPFHVQGETLDGQPVYVLEQGADGSGMRGGVGPSVPRRVRIDAQGVATATVRFVAVGTRSIRRAVAGAGPLLPGEYRLRITLDLVSGPTTVVAQNVRVL